MQVVPSGGQIRNQCKWRHLVAKFATYASGTIWWSNLQLMQVAPSGGRICNWWKWCHLVAKFGTNASVIIFISWRNNSSWRGNTLGPLCLWQCLKVAFLNSECICLVFHHLFQGITNWKHDSMTVLRRASIRPIRGQIFWPMGSLHLKLRPTNHVPVFPMWHFHPNSFPQKMHKKTFLAG